MWAYFDKSISINKSRTPIFKLLGCLNRMAHQFLKNHQNLAWSILSRNYWQNYLWWTELKNLISKNVLCVLRCLKVHSCDPKYFAKIENEPFFWGKIDGLFLWDTLVIQLKWKGGESNKILILIPSSCLIIKMQLI